LQPTENPLISGKVKNGKIRKNYSNFLLFCQNPTPGKSEGEKKNIAAEKIQSNLKLCLK
jgi:hypothetical protein